MANSPTPGSAPANAEANRVPVTGRDEPRLWDQLSGDEQTALRIEYGHYLDGLPPTCSPEEKERRFAGWLAERGIRFSGQR